MNNFANMKIVVHPDTVRIVPNMQLSARVREVMSPEYVEDTNLWMLEFFGTHTVVENLIPDDTYVVIESERQIIMNPRMYGKLMQAVIADNRGST